MVTSWVLYVANDKTETLANKTIDNTVNTIPNAGGPIYTALIAGTTTKLKNNITGLTDYTADNAVNSVTAINSAAGQHSEHC